MENKDKKKAKEAYSSTNVIKALEKIIENVTSIELNRKEEIQKQYKN